VRDVPRGDVLDCKTERAGERMAEAPRRSIRKLDFYCADPRGRVAFPSLDLFNLPRFTAAAIFWTRDCVGELLLWAVVMPLPHLVPLERPPQPELDFRAQRAHLPPRFCGQHLSQIILEADREAPILVRVVSHRNPLVGRRQYGARIGRLHA
jgi:hypothetical protein